MPTPNPDPGWYLHEGLVERDREVARLVALMDAAAAGRGRLLLLEGPAGIGKTRLLQAARELAERRELNVLSARGSELERDYPFGVVRQLLEPGLARFDPGERERFFAGAARHAEPLFTSGNGEAVRPGDPDYATLHGLYWLVVALAEAQPMLALFDDVHWADSPSLRFLSFLATRLDGVPVAVAAARRPAEQGTDPELMSRLAVEVDAELLEPRPLTRDGVSELIDHLLHREPDGRFVEACHGTTGGNPFYLSSLLADAATAGVEPTAANANRVPALGSGGVARLLLRRLRALSPGAVEFARAVAVLGDGATLAIAAALAGLDESSAVAAAAALERASILREGARTGFVHPVSRSAIYDQMPARERSERHAAAARLLTAENATEEEVAIQLLYAPAGALPQATVMLGTAAARALERGAPETAAAYLQRSLEERLDDEERADMLDRLGRAESRFDPAAARDHLRAALDQPGAAPAIRGRAAVDLARVLTTIGRTTDAIDLLARVGGELGESAREVKAELEAELLLTAATNLYPVPPAVAERARALAAGGRGDGGLLEDAALAWRSTEVALAGESAAEAAALRERALVGGRLHSHGLAGGQMVFYLMVGRIAGEDFEAAARYLGDAIEQASRVGAPVAYAIASAQRSWLEYRRGALVAAEADARAALEVARLNRLGLPELMAVAALCEVLAERGAAELAAREVAMVPVEEAAHENPQGVRALEARGRLRLALGETEAGVADLAAAGEHFLQAGVRNPALFSWRSSLAPGLKALGRRDEAARLAEEELTLARRWGTPRCVGVAMRTRGVVAEGHERLELLREAVDVLQGSQARLEHARAWCELGAELRRGGHRRDAREPLAAALELAHRCGATVLEHQARTELRAAGARPRQPLRTGVDALTASELRIVELAASGRSNPEIAQTLFVTVKTIEGHLSGAYRKLDVHSRSQLTRALERSP